MLNISLAYLKSATYIEINYDYFLHGAFENKFNYDFYPKAI